MKGELGFGIVSNCTPKSFYTWGLFDVIIASDDGKPYLPFAQSLLQGEQIVKISRQKIFRHGEQTEAITIFFYQEVTDNSKAGAYIGSAFAFTAQPTQLFLSNTVKAFHNNVLTHQELLEGSATVPPRFISFPTDDLLMGTPIPGKTVTQLGVYSVFVGGTLLDYILPLVQGFMYNPNFQQLQTLYASDNKELLKRIHGGEEDNIFGIEHLLNFNRYFREQTEKMEKLRQEYAALEQKTKGKRGELTNGGGANAFKIRSADEKEKLNHEIAVLKKQLYSFEEELKKRNEFYVRLNEKIYSDEKEGDEKLQQLRKEVKLLIDESKKAFEEIEDKKRFSNKLEKEILSLQDQHKEWEQKNSRAKDAIKKLEEKQNAIKESNYTVFKSLLEAPKFKEEKFRYDKGNPEVLSLQDELRYFKAKEKEKKEKFWIKIAYLVGTGLLLLIGGYLLGNFKSIFNKRKEVEIENVAGVETEDKVDSLSLKLLERHQLKESFSEQGFKSEGIKKKEDEKLKQILQEYVGTAYSGDYNTWDEINAKFPELSSYDPKVLQEYVGTVISGDYSTWDEINAKFPEFFDVGKPEEVSGQDSSNVVYEYLKSEGMTDVSEKEFVDYYTDRENLLPVYEWLRDNGNTDIGFEEFADKYFPISNPQQQSLHSEKTAERMSPKTKINDDVISKEEDLKARVTMKYNTHLNNQNRIFKEVDVEPMPPGGMAAFREWISNNYVIPQKAIDAGVKGIIQVSFVVEKDGTLVDIKLVRDLAYETGDAAVRLLTKAPKWSPGMMDDKPVRVGYTLPISINAQKK